MKKPTIKKKKISRNAAEQAIRRMCTPRKRTNRRKVSEQIARQFFEGGTGRGELIKAFMDCDGDHEPQLLIPLNKYIYIYIYTHFSKDQVGRLSIWIHFFEVDFFRYYNPSKMSSTPPLKEIESWTNYYHPLHAEEAFRRKAELVISRQRSKKSRVEAGWYSEETMKNELKMSQQHDLVNRRRYQYTLIYIYIYI